METVIAEGMDHFPKMATRVMEKAKKKAAEAAREMAREVIPVS
jgi:FMN-dependent NADH-azoreductase